MNESELLRQLTNPDWEVRKAASWNPNATEPVLLVAVKDEWWWVRRASVTNPSH